MDNLESNIRYIEEIPPTYRAVFQEYPCFNTVQSSVLEDALYTDKSLVVSAPTGSGKTAIFEMAIVRLLMLNENTGLIPNIKMIYISPIKALCRERLIDWHKKFSDYGIKCIALTSDTNDIDARNISLYNLIICTPEKWDVVTRRWRDNQKLVAAINLFMIDEVHLLNADSRGSTLEVIVSRMKTAEGVLMLNEEKPKIRFIALSATIPNVEDIAEWIEPTGTAKYFKFLEDVRPVKLEKVVYGVGINNKSPFKFDLFLNYKIPNLIYKYSKGKPTLIFCNTRKSVEMTTNHLVTNLQIRLSQEQKEVLNQISGQINDTKLRQFIVHGIALHHAGLIPENRDIIETSFRQGHLPILVTTSTLAMGVNLPAHLVIVKGTKRYETNKGYKDYDEVSIFQMIGRAGRNQFDTTATALILTSIQDKKKYEQMLSCTQKIESNLHKHLTEHLNAEIVLKTITDLNVAMNWLSSTFLYVRAKKCPEKYKLPAGLSKEKIDKKLLEICQIDLNKLVRAGMIKMNQEIEVAPTVVGEIMAKYYIDFNTMELFTKTSTNYGSYNYSSPSTSADAIAEGNKKRPYLHGNELTQQFIKNVHSYCQKWHPQLCAVQISGNEIMIQILALLSKCHEFSEIHLRSNDKKYLNLLNKNAHKESIRFPLTGKIRTADMKINCIIQAVLGNLDISDQSIINDSVKVMRSCERLANCLIEYLETRTQCYTALLNTTILAKCFRIKLWENSPYVSKQLTGVGQVISTLLAKAGKTTFKYIVNTNPRHIEMIVGRKAPFGNTIIDEALHLPEYQMTMQKYNNEVNLVITLLNPSDVEDKPTVNLSSKMTLLVGNSDNNILLYEKYAHSYMLDHLKVTRSINIENQNVAFITADLISEDWVGIDCHFKLELLVKPTNAINQPTNTKQNKISKQTFMDTYMQSLKGGNIIKKVKTISKENTTNFESQSRTTEKQENTTNNTEETDQNLVKNKNDSKRTNMSDTVCKEENLNYGNCGDDIRPTNNINNNCLELTGTATLQAKQTIQSSTKKTENSRKKKILVSKSIFRTKSKSKHLERRQSKEMNYASPQLRRQKIIDKPKDQNQSVDGNRQINYITTGHEGGVSEKLFPSKPQINYFEKDKTTDSHISKSRNAKNTEITASAKSYSFNSQMSVLKKNKFISEDQQLQTWNADNTNMTASKEPFSYKSEINILKKNKATLNDCKLKTISGAGGIERVISGEIFPYESQMNAAMDAYEMNTNIMKKSKLGSNNEGCTKSDDTNTFKNFNTNYSNAFSRNINKLCIPNTLISYKDHNSVSNEYSPLYFDTEELLPLQSQRNLSTNRKNIKQNGSKNLNKEANTLSKHLNYTDDDDYDKNKIKDRSHSFQISPDCDDDRKMDLPNKSECGINYNENNTSSKQFDNKNFIKPSQEHNSFKKNKNASFLEDICDSKLYADFYKKYNSKIESENENSVQNFPEEQIITTKKMKSRENQGKNMKITMDYPDSIPKQNFFQPDGFLTPRSKRHRGVDDYCSEESQAKRIKWRSPLVQSPPEMFLPHAKSRKSFCFDFGNADLIDKEDTKESNDLRSGTQDTTSSSTNLNLSGNSQKHSNIASSSASIRKKLGFPLCDQDCINISDSFDGNIKYLEEVCDLEYYGLANRQAISQKDTAKNSLRPASSAHEYYSQLMRSPRNNLRKDTGNDEKFKHRNGFASYEPVSKTALIPSPKLQQSSIPDTNFLYPNSVMPYMQIRQFSRPSETNIYSQNIPREQKCNIKAYNPQISNEIIPNNQYRDFEKAVNYVDDMNARHHEIHMPKIAANDESIHHGYVNLQKTLRELPPRYLGNYYLDDGRFALQPSPYFGYQQPFSDEMMYRHHEMLSSYKIPSRYPSSMDIRHPIPRYVNIDPNCTTGFKLEANYPVTHNNTNQRTTPTYYLEGGTIPEDYFDQYTQHSQSLDLKSSHFGNDKNQGKPTKHFRTTNPFERKLSDSQNRSTNVFFPNNLYEQENFNPQFSQRIKNNLMFGQTCSRPTIYNNQSQSDISVRPSTANVFSESSQKFLGICKDDIKQLFSPMPKRQLQHSSNLNMSQSQKPTLPETPNQHLIIPSSQGRMLNFHSFDDRLENVILPRNQGCTLSTTKEQQYDPRNTLNTAFYKPNDKEFVMNKFLFSNNRK